MQPQPAIVPCNLEAPEDWLRLSKLSPGETKGPWLVCRNPKPKSCQSWLGVSFFKPRRWSGLNICFFLLSRCRCLLVSGFSFRTFRQLRNFQQTIFSCWLMDCRHDYIPSLPSNGWDRIHLPAYFQNVHT